ncbi:MAG: hypothetical protein QGF59_11645 [Pirellulaceae bacterium]|jgi:hypothetical protein|nr:hypothetical protein [Pirellulaceae bacterium]
MTFRIRNLALENGARNDDQETPNISLDGPRAQVGAAIRQGVLGYQRRHKFNE